MTLTRTLVGTALIVAAGLTLGLGSAAADSSADPPSPLKGNGGSGSHDETGSGESPTAAALDTFVRGVFGDSVTG